MKRHVRHAAWVGAVAILFFCRPVGAVETVKPKPTQDKAEAQKWTSLFDGKTLGKWQVITKYDFEDHGKITVDKGILKLGAGSPASGIRWTGPMPKSNYEIRLDAKRTAGSDFFCGMTFPVGKTFCTLIVGGWGGTTVGLSNVDDEAASENLTTHIMKFKDDTWYAIRLRVTDQRISVWIDGKKVIDLPTEGHELAIWWEQEPARPLGISTWLTGSALRNIQLRRLDAKALKQ
ncbi:MAG: DUF1080 domain-containing protein [Pirellulales bacterium]|nr:DUF1080 domain-containing protein [Pirellulales bacterium]